MRIRRITWVGTRTERVAETVRFFSDVLGLRVVQADERMTALGLEDGSLVEVFSPADPDHGHFTTGPVVGFLVDDLAAASEELRAAGVELLGPPGRGAGAEWQHFRAPDGNVYELTSRDADGGGERATRR